MLATSLELLNKRLVRESRLVKILLRILRTLDPQGLLLSSSPPKKDHLVHSKKQIQIGTKV